MEVRQCAFADLADAPNFDELTALYAEECAIAGLPRPAPDIDSYTMMERANIMATMCAYHNGTIIGFLTLLVVRLPHYSAPVASTESFFVDPDFRNTGAGMALLNQAEKEATMRGAIGMLVSAPTNGKLDRVLEKHGAYRETNRVFFRGLTCLP